MFDARLLLSVLLVLVAATGAGVAGQPSGPQADTQVRSTTGVSVEATTIGSETTDRSQLLSAAIADAVDVGPPLVAVGAYSRFDDSSDPLEHDTREDIYETVTTFPGLSLAQTSDRTDADHSTVRYHCRVLEHEGLLDRESIGGQRRLFPVTNGFDEDSTEQALQAALRNEAQSAVLTSVGRGEPISVSALASTLDRADSTVSYHLDRLETRDLIDRTKVGRTVEVRLSDAVRERIPST